MVRPLWIYLAVLLAGMPLSGCKRQHESQDMNESLRLTPEQVARDKRAVDAGDVEAAHRLWLHYAAELDMEKGDLWMKRYESLRGATPQTK